VEAKRVRPAPSSASHFKNFDLIQASTPPWPPPPIHTTNYLCVPANRIDSTLHAQVGLGVDIKHDSVWWKGLVVGVMPAGVNVWMPGEK
jgi:hypothetical protein